MSADSATVETMFEVKTSIRSGITYPNWLTKSRSAASLSINLDVIPAISRSRRIDIYVVPGLAQILRKPIPVVMRKEDDLFLAECRELDIVEGGTSEGEALEEFSRFFAIEVQSLLSASDESLDEDALQLRNRYREYLGA